MNDTIDRAFKSSRSRLYSWRLHSYRIFDFKSQRFNLARFCIIVGRSLVHRFGEIKRNNMDNEFAGRDRIDEAVLERSIAPVDWTEHQRGRVGSDSVEETERSQVRDARFRNCRHPGDRTRSDEIYHVLVNVSNSGFVGINLHSDGI